MFFTVVSHLTSLPTSSPPPTKCNQFCRSHFQDLLAMKERFTENCDAANLLFKILKDGDRKGRENPRAAWESEAVFQEYSLAVF